MTETVGACILAFIGLMMLDTVACAQAPIKVDNPEILVVVFDYDGLTVAPEVTQISFILYSDGTFALMDRAPADGDAFIQGKLSADEALDFAKQTEADLADVSSDAQGLEDMGARGGFEIWHWNPADHTYVYPMRIGHPCHGDAPAASNPPGLEAFCRRLQDLRNRDGVEQRPVRTSFVFTRADNPPADIREIPATLGARAIDTADPLVGLCTDDTRSNAAMAALIAPGAGGPVGYRFDDLPPLELTQIFRATDLKKTYDVPLGDVMQSVGDPCDAIRSQGPDTPTSP